MRRRWSSGRLARHRTEGHLKNGKKKPAAAKPEVHLVGQDIREQLFVAEFLISKNATDAAKRAGYSEASAAETGRRLLMKPAIRERVSDALERSISKLEKGRNDIYAELVKVGFANIADLLEWDSKVGITLKPKAELTPAQLAAIAEIQEFETIIPRQDGEPIVKRRFKVKLHPKIEALIKLDDLFEQHGSEGEEEVLILRHIKRRRVS